MKIVPLSKMTLKQAQKLLRGTFPKQTRSENSDFWLAASLDNSYKKRSVWPECTWIKYWVAVDKGRVAGITGLYKTKKDSRNAHWLSWTCVSSACRGRGIGGMLVDRMIARSRSDGKKFIRLYTSPRDPVQKAAQALYRKKGFVKTGSALWRGKKYKVAFMELKL